MRLARWKVPGDRAVGYYHCLSRVVDRRFIFGPAEKEKFVALMREYEEFCSVRVLTFCVMSNHFHILLEVPRRPERLPTMEELLAKLEKLSALQDLARVRAEWERCRRAGDQAAEAAMVERYVSRMWDVSAFMKVLKGRFTQWYNGRKERRGTLWEERFRSVMVDGAGPALAVMAAYIDLNPVRAGLVEDPKEYRWCGYAEAVAGVKRACAGLGVVVEALQRGRAEGTRRTLEVYRMYVYGEGEVEVGGPEPETAARRPARSPGAEAAGLKGGSVDSGRPRVVSGDGRRGWTREEVKAVVREGGRLGTGEYLRLRVRYLSAGVALGGRMYVEGLFQNYRGRFGPARKDGARRMRGLREDLFTLRALQVDLFG